jgi:lysozyme family protein
MALKKFHEETDWSLAHLLYRFEAYNGFGYRGRGINTPYLWSFSNQYTKGKYVADGRYDANAVSKQCGAAVLVKELAERGIITLPARV